MNSASDEKALLPPPATDEKPLLSPGAAKAWARTKHLLGRYGRWFLLVAGVVALALLVRSVGPALLLEVMLEAGPWLPLVLFFDLAWVAFEGLALLLLYGPPARSIPLRAWIETTLVHYTTMAILPVGRAGAEVARATLFSPYVGKSRAAAGAAMMQTLTLVANTVMSLACLIGVLLVVGNDKLAWLILINGTATLVLGLGLYLVTQRAQPGGWLGQRFEALAHFGPELDEHFRESRPRHLSALALGIAGRSLQTVQYGVLLLAVTGSFTLLGTLVAQGIHLVGAGLGDMVPNQVGVTEGAYRVFAGALGLVDRPERAVAIAVLARVSSLCVAGLCALGAQLMPKSRPS
ncbi:MAG TPA: hypothetical protein VLC09_03425 [Polyangiaceae bacterium]|nr:hypothetical protein [Polyangiaceae bacterium]